MVGVDSEFRGSVIYKACIPTTFTFSQAILLFSYFVNSHPEYGDKAFLTAALAALQQTYPCAAK